MSKQTTKQTHKSLGLVPEHQIQLWSSQAKRKAKLYQHKIHSATLKKHKQVSPYLHSHKPLVENQQELSIILNSSLNTLRSKTKSERSNSSSISNRMKYLEVDLKRKRQMAEIAKNKYQKMMETRTKSFQEKSMLHKEREYFIKNYHQSVTIQASRIRVQRNNSMINTKNLKTKNYNEARKIKQRSHLNQKLIEERQLMQVEKKKRMVEQSHQIQEIGRQKLKYLSKAKELQAKQTHNKKILQEYAKVQMQKRKTNTLTVFFKSKVKELQESTKRYTSELRQYEQFLGMRLNQKFKHLNSDNNTLYLTH